MSRATPPARRAFPYAAVLTVALGHFVHDTFTAFFAPLLPLLRERLNLSLGLAGSLTFFLQAPSLFNPVIGFWADRTRWMRWFVVLAPGLTATGMTLLGWTSDYAALAVLLLAVGVSVAMFHAPAPALVARLAEPYTGRGMSIFMAAGELGRAVGPVLAVSAAAWWGLPGLPRLAALGWLASAVLFWRLARVEPLPRDRRWNDAALHAWLRRWAPPLAVLILGRAFMVGALNVFLPTFLHAQGRSVQAAGWITGAYEAAGVLGALTSGTLSDFLGRKRTLVLVQTLAVAFLWAFVATPDPWRVAWLLPLGFTALAAQPIMLALVQDHAHQARATANGVYLALSFALRPIAVTLSGMIGDAWGLKGAFALGGGLALLSLLALRKLPGDALRAGRAG